MSETDFYELGNFKNQDQMRTPNYQNNKYKNSKNDKFKTFHNDKSRISQQQLQNTFQYDKNKYTGQNNKYLPRINQQLSSHYKETEKLSSEKLGSQRQTIKVSPIYSNNTKKDRFDIQIKTSKNLLSERSQKDLNDQINLASYQRKHPDEEFERLVNDNCSQTEEGVKKIKGSRKRKQITLLIINCIFTLNVAAQNIIFFFLSQSDYKYDYLAPTIGMMNLFFILNSIYHAKSIKQFFALFFMLDTILLTQAIASIGFVGLMQTVDSGKWYQKYAYACVPLLHFTMSGNFRVMSLNFHWTKTRTIIYKICIFMGAITYFCIGAYIMYIDFKITKGFQSSTDSSFKDFALLYVFGNFSFFNQTFGKISDWDKTSDLAVKYKLEIQQEQEEQSTKTQLKSQKSRQIVHPEILFDTSFINKNKNKVNFQQSSMFL